MKWMEKRVGGGVEIGVEKGVGIEVEIEGDIGESIVGVGIEVEIEGDIGESIVVRGEIDMSREVELVEG